MWQAQIDKEFRHHIVKPFNALEVILAMLEKTQNCTVRQCSVDKMGVIWTNHMVLKGWTSTRSISQFSTLYNIIVCSLAILM